jgi:hypothetical protein
VLTASLTGHSRLKNYKWEAMKRIFTSSILILFVQIFFVGILYGQNTVPAGINYQAVARDSDGDELVNTDIEVQFSIRTGSPTGTIVYQEVFTDVTTSKYGVFSLIIGKGTMVGGTVDAFADIDWSTANHYLQVEVKFENTFLDMGTMQFMAVPYALYAGKTLMQDLSVNSSDELSITGGSAAIVIDRSSENELQTLTYNANSRDLTISGTNSTVDLGTEVAFRAQNLESDVAPQLSDVTMTYDAPDLSIGGGFNAGTGIFTAPANGIYTFNVAYLAVGAGVRDVSIYKNSALYEVIAKEVGSSVAIPVRSVTIRLNTGDTVEIKISTGTATQTGTGSFAGYKVD